MSISKYQSITLETAAQCIRHDPASWKGIPLLCLQQKDGVSLQKVKFAIKNAVGNPSEMLELEAGDGNWLLFGVRPSRESLADVKDSYFWINDIAEQWQLACNLLDAVRVAAKTNESNTEVNTQLLSSSLSILVVEDDAMTSKMVTHHLQQFGVVNTTKNAREAMANNMVCDPDIIFLDIHYKDDIYDGFDVLTNILSTNPNRFVVMFSASRDPSTILKALTLGAQGFIAKPFHATDFLHYLTKLEQNR
jgi:CheY-like chemotaxis protein